MGKVLVVDDKELMRDSVAAILSRKGHTVLTAPDARAAWLAEACDGDEGLLAEVKRLLAADELAERAMPTGGLRPDDAPMPAEPKLTLPGLLRA